MIITLLYSSRLPKNIGQKLLEVTKENDQHHFLKK